MLFAYPERPHIRKHGPSGYEDYRSYKDWLRDEFTFRCVYCLERERWYPSGQDAFAVEHVTAAIARETLLDTPRLQRFASARFGRATPLV